MRLVFSFAAATLAAALASAPPPADEQAPSNAPSPVLGISYASSRDGILGRFDPLTLKALPGRKVNLAGHDGSWAFSGDRSVLAAANCDMHDAPSIRFVNARGMRVFGDVRLSPSDYCVQALTWLRPRRLLAVVTSGMSNAAAVAVVDPLARRLLRRVQITAPGDTFLSAQATRDELVLLLARYDSFAPARLAVVDSEGDVRRVTVERTTIGTVYEQESGDEVGRTISPGFAVDPDGGRAYLVPPSGPVAEVDLQTLGVSYHDLDHPSLLQRLLRWLTPAAEAKGEEGQTRWATWAGDGVLALAGVDSTLERNASGNLLEVDAPTGVELIDTGAWQSHLLSRESSEVAVAPGLVIVEGGRYDWDAQKMVGPGVIAFGLDGSERWRLPPSSVWIEAHPALGYGYLDDDQGHVRVLDLETGAVVRTLARDRRQHPGPFLLDGQHSDW